MFAKEKNNPIVPMPPVPAPRRAPEPQMSESYARALHEFDQLKATLHEAMTERDQLRVDLGIEKRENERLHSNIAELEEKLDIFRRRVNEIETRFDDVSALILRVMDSRLTEPKQKPALANLEQEITGPHEDTPHER